jgi:hypothetical protein
MKGGLLKAFFAEPRRIIAIEEGRGTKAPAHLQDPSQPPKMLNNPKLKALPEPSFFIIIKQLGQ